MKDFLEGLEGIWENGIVRALVYLLLALVVSLVASLVVKRLFKITGLTARLDKWGISEGESGGAKKFVGRLVFLIVFLLFLPAVLGALGIDGVSETVADFAAAFIDYVPNIIAAAILIFLGIFIGRILCGVLTALLKRTKIDSLARRGGSADGDGNGENTDGAQISAIIGKAVEVIIILIAIVEALTVLNVKAISEPALNIIGRIFGAVPSLLLAAITVALGVIIARLVSGLVGGALSATGLDGALNKILPNMKRGFAPSALISGAVRWAIIIFSVAQGVEVLGLEVLSEISAGVIAYIPAVIKAIFIALLAALGAHLADGIGGSAPLGITGKILKAIIYVLAAFMILSQLGFAATIVNYAFIISLSALAIAFAVSFGIGGRDFAKRTLDGIKTKKTKNDENNEKQN